MCLSVLCVCMCSESQPGRRMESGVGAGRVPSMHSQGTHQAGLVSGGG